jgi:pimeloyl-ACP methyl ester carboxylesterase
MSPQQPASTQLHAGPVDVGDGELWVEQRGQGPDVLLLCGLGDPIEVWQPQLDALSDRYRLTAFDNRGVGRTKLTARGCSAATMADDAAAVVRAMGIPAAHVMGFSGGSAMAQELALRHPDLVRSLVLMSTYARADAHFRSALTFWRWMVESAPGERAAFEAFFLWIYTPRAHENGMVDELIDEALEFAHPQSVEEFQAQLDVFLAHDTFDRLGEIRVPTLVLAGEVDIITPPRQGRLVADRIPGAEFEVLPGEAHQPFQESPEDFNARVDAFWQRVEAGA